MLIGPSLIRRRAPAGRLAAITLLVGAMLLSIGSVAAQSPSASAPPSSAALTLDPVAAHSSWFQLDERSYGRSVLRVGRVTGPAHEVGIVAGATLLHSDAGAPAVLAWTRTRRGSEVRRVFADGAIVSTLTSRALIGVATGSGDGRWLIWATQATDGTTAGVFRRKVSQHASQRIERLSGRLPFRAGRILADRRGDNVVVQGSGPESNMGVVLLRPAAASVDLPLTDWQTIGLAHGQLIVGTPAGDGTAGPPFLFTDLTSLDTRILEAGPGSHALVIADGTLAWESTDAAGLRTVVTVNGPEEEPRTLWTADSDAEPGLHLVGATETAGVGPEAWLGLFPGGRPYHEPTADTPSSGGLFIRLDGTGAAPIAAIAPPILEGQLWTPVLRSEEAVSIDAVTRTPRGLLAVGWVGERRRLTFWTSTDGRRWNRRPAPIRPNAPLGTFRIFARGDRVVLAAGENRNRGGNHVRIWTSTDGGRSWDALAAGPRFGAGPALSAERAGASAYVPDIGWLDGRFAVTGLFCVEGCDRPTLWTSRDLATWTRTDLRPRIDGRPLDPTRLVVGHGRLLLTAWDDRPTESGATLVTSPDGRRWTDLGPLPGDPFPHLVDGRRGLTLVGRPTDAGPLTVWRSTDGRTWEQTYQDPYAWGVRDVVASDGSSRASIVVLGIVMADPVNEDYQNGALVSTQGGAWVRSVGSMTPQNSSAEVAVFLDPRTVVALGWSDGGGFPAGWRTELAP